MAKDENLHLRTRNFNLVTYANEASIRSILKQHAYKANFIFHDNDKDKKPHWHICLRLKEATTGSAVLKWFADAVDDDGVVQNTLIEVCNSLKSSLRYLIHLDDKDKYQYPIGSVRSWGEGAIADFNTAVSDDNKELDSATLAVLDILEGRSIRSCVMAYGRDFIYHYESIRKVADMIYYEEHYSKEELNKNDKGNLS